MNKIYKLVWSPTLGQFVVTSEVASSRGKSGGRQGGTTVTSTVLQSWLVDKPMTLLYSATLVAAMAYSSAADADVLYNQSFVGSGDNICTNINDTDGATHFIGEWINARCAMYRTSTTIDANFYRTMGTDRSALALGGELFVNGGKIGLADYVGGTYGMRIGSVATVDAAIGLDAIAIGTAQTAANDGATSSPTTASAARAIAIGSATSSTAADALALGTTASASATNAIAIGTQSRADAAEAVAIGTNAVATGGRAVSIGSGNVANGNGAVAIGDPNTATGSGAIAQGLDNTATGNGAVAMGNTNMVGGGGQAVGVAGTAAQGAVGIGYQNTVAGQGAVGIGDRNTVNGTGAVTLGRQSNATGLSAIALGLTANATNTYAVAIGGLAAASGENAVAMGQGANATMLDSLALGSNAVAGASAGDVALGASSSTAVVVATTGATIDGVAYTYAGTAPQSTVSVGQPGFERTITNVAAGRVDATSTDAINGSQLLATNLAVDALGTDLDTLGSSTAASLGGTSAYDPATHTVSAGLAVGGTTYTNVQDALTQLATVTNAGWNVSAQGANATNVAPGEAVDLNNSDGNIVVSKTATDDNITFDLADNITVTSVTAGGTVLDASGLTIAGGPSVTTVGIDAGNTVITNVAPGAVSSTSTDAVNGSQLFAVSEVANAGWNISDGTSSGNIAPDETLTVAALDSNASVTYDDASSTLTVGVVADPSFNSITVGDTVINDGSVSFASGGPSLTSTGIDAGGTVITNVAPGVAGTDAVNVDQLTALGDTGLTFTGNDNTAGDVQRALGSTLAIQGGATTAGTYSGGNLQTVTDPATGTIHLQMADSPVFGATTINAGGTGIISGVTAGVAGTDAVNVDQLTALGSSTASSLGGTSAYDPATQTVTAGLAVGGTTYTNVQDALTQLDTVANAGWNISDGTSSGNIAPDETLTVAALDSNTSVVYDDATSTLTVGVVADPSFNSITVGDTVINDGSVSFTSGGPSLTSTGIDAGGTVITNVAPGVAGTDAVNVDQLTAVSDVANAGWNISAQGANATNVAPGETVDLNNSDGNIVVSKTTTSDNVTFDLADDITVTSVTAGGTVLNSSGLTIAGGPSVTTVGIDAGGTVITNVAPGVAGTDAVNVDQVTTLVDGARTHYYSVNDNGVVGGNYDNDGATGINALAAGVDTSAAGDAALALGYGAAGSGLNAIAIGTDSLASNTGSIAIGQDTVSSGLDTIAIGTGASATNSVALGARASAGAGGTALGDGANATLAGGVALGKNSVEGAANATASTTIAGTTYTFAGTTPTSVVSVGSVGAERQITNVAAGQLSATSTDAVNGSQLYATNQAIEDVAAGLTHYYSVNDNGVAGGNYDNDGATGINALAAGVGASATADSATAIGEGAVAGAQTGDVALGSGSTTAAVVATASGSVDGVTYTYAGTAPTSTVSVGSVGAERTVTHVAAGQVSSTSTDAVNGSQLFATNQAVGSLGVNLDQVGASTAASLGGTSVYDPITHTVTGGLSVGGSTYTTVQDALTQVNTTASAGWNITDGTRSGNIGAGETLAVAAGSNASVTYDDATGTLTVGVVPDPSFTSVAIGNTSITTDGLTIIGGPGITIAGIDAGGTTITNVAAGVNGTDAVNVDQLNQVVEGASAHYYSVNDGGVNGGNYANDGATATGAIASGVSASATATDAVAIGTGATAGDANSVALGAGSATSVAVGTAGTTIAGTDYTFAGGVPVGTVSVGDAGSERTITHVAAGRLSATSTDAVNGSQLYATNQAVDALDGRVTTVEGDVANLTETVGGFDSRITNVEGDVANLTETVNTFDGRITNVQNGADGMFQVSQESAITKPAPTGTNAAAGGNGAVASGDNALAVGNQSTASGNDSTALGNGATASHGNSVALGAGSATTVGAQNNYNAAYVGDSTSTGEVNVGGRTISGVAAGVAGTDAVNVSQLNGGVNYAINQANAYTDSRLSGFYSDMWTMRREARGGTASAMAMAGLPQAYLPGKSMLAVAAGGYQGEYGMAVGLSGVTENGRWVYKAQASGNTVRDWGFSVGAGIQW